MPLSGLIPLRHADRRDTSGLRPRIAPWIALCVLCLGLLGACGSSQASVTPQASVAPAPASPSAAPPSATLIPASPSVAPASPSAAPPSAAPAPAADASAVATVATGELAHVFPVKNPACQYSSSHHDYPASDILCPIGTEYVAVTSGVVDFVSLEDIWNPATDNPTDRGGLSVAIIGDDGVRYYGSHLSAIAEGIAPGARVAAGQRLGLTGRSGNARGTAPHVHFGISRPTTPDDWQTRRGQVWPQKYLAAWKRGKNVTPALL